MFFSATAFALLLRPAWNNDEYPTSLCVGPCSSRKMQKRDEESHEKKRGEEHKGERHRGRVVWQSLAADYTDHCVRTTVHTTIKGFFLLPRPTERNDSDMPRNEEGRRHVTAVVQEEWRKGNLFSAKCISTVRNQTLSLAVFQLTSVASLLTHSFRCFVSLLLYRRYYGTRMVCVQVNATTIGMWTNLKNMQYGMQ